MDIIADTAKRLGIRKSFQYGIKNLPMLNSHNALDIFHNKNSWLNLFYDIEILLKHIIAVFKNIFLNKPAYVIYNHL